MEKMIRLESRLIHSRLLVQILHYRAVADPAGLSVQLVLWKDSTQRRQENLSPFPSNS